MTVTNNEIAREFAERLLANLLRQSGDPLGSADS